MKPKYYIPIFIIIAVLSVVIFLSIQTMKNNKTKNENPLYTIRQINKMNKSGIFNIEGYVVYVSYCPPCSAGASCAACPPSYLVISDRTNVKRRHEDCTEAELPVGREEWVAPTRDFDFELNKKYKLIIEVFKREESGYYRIIDSCENTQLIGKLLAIEKIE